MIHTTAQPGPDCSFAAMIGNLISVVSRPEPKRHSSRRNHATSNPAWIASCAKTNAEIFAESRAAIVKAITEHGPLSRARIVELSGIAIRTAAKHLNRMKSTGEIRNFGKANRPVWGFA